MRLIAKVAAAAAIGVVTLAPQAGASQPQLPDLPSVDEARFQMTIRGHQLSHFDFRWTPGNSCGQHAEGDLTELWKYARGKAVVMVFTKFGPGAILLQRVGRPQGDSAFAAPGTVIRRAAGFFDMGPILGCGGWHSLIGPTCGQEFKVQNDLRLTWFKGKLTIEKSGSKPRENPADGCGQVDVMNYDELPLAYPLLFKQRAALSAKDIFGKKKGFRLDLKSKFLPGVPPSLTWPDSAESLKGSTELTFKRLKDG